MRKDQKIRNAFQFLKERAEDKSTFTIDELALAAGWTRQNTETNLSKRLGEFVSPASNGHKKANRDIFGSGSIWSELH